MPIIANCALRTGYGASSVGGSRAQPLTSALATTFYVGELLTTVG